MWEGPRGGFRTRGGEHDKQLYRFPPSIEALLPKDMRLDGEIWSRREPGAAGLEPHAE